MKLGAATMADLPHRCCLQAVETLTGTERSVDVTLFVPLRVGAEHMAPPGSDGYVKACGAAEEVARRLREDGFEVSFILRVAGKWSRLSKGMGSDPDMDFVESFDDVLLLTDTRGLLLTDEQRRHWTGRREGRVEETNGG